jgi:RHS repeat-associated protein
VSFANLDVTTVKDAQEVASSGAGTAFSHTAPFQTQVVRRGSGTTQAPDTTTRSTLVSASDPHARIATVARKLGAAWITTATTWDTTYPIEPATVTEDSGGSLQRTTTTTYVASSLGLVAKVVEPLTATDERWTEYVYNANNDVTEKKVSLEGLTSPAPTITRSCYTTSGCSTSATDLLLRATIDGYVDGTKGGANGDDEDVTTDYLYDAYGQKTRETRHNYDGSTLLDSRALAWTYDANGNVTTSIQNHADGAVSSPGDDITPNASTNARTDLTTTFTYDTAGNEVSVADPRRAIALATAGTTHALDNFDRSVTDGWGTAGTGGSWSGTSAEFDVNGAVGTIALASANNKNGYLASVSAADQELLVKVNVNQLAAGGDTFTWFYLRRQDASNFYELRATFEPDQELRLSFRKTVGGSASSIGSATLSGETHTTGNWYWIRARLTGTTSVNLKARLWRDGSTEPPTWALDATDAAPPAALQGAGHLGVRFQATGSGTYPVTASYDDLSLTTIGGTSGLGADDYVARSEYDALDQRTKQITPTTPGVVIAQKNATWTYDELGAVRQAKDHSDVLTATAYDSAGRATKTFEDEDGAGGIAAAQASETTYDPSGRTLIAKDRRQVADGTLGDSRSYYDELGRMYAQIDAFGTSADTETDFTFDALDRQLTVITGAEDSATAQKTAYTYDLGGRALTTDDEFTCQSTTYDYRDLPLTVIEGQTSGSCTGSGLRTITNTFDKLGRLYKAAVTAGLGNGDTTMDDRLDSAGRHVFTSATRGGATTTTSYKINGLEQTWEEVRSEGSTAKTNFDAAGNGTDRCFWRSGTAGACSPVGTLPWPNQPTQSTTTVFDARNNRIGLTDSATSATTVYDPAHDYQVDAVYTPTVAGTGREYQALYDYDTRDRLTSITHQLCVISSGHACSSSTAMGSTTFEYDANDNRTRVNESTSVGSLDRHYCYDALDRVLSTRSATGCSTGLVEAYTYDDSGNRTAAGSTTFAYDGEGQLSSCSPSCGTVAYDAAGRTSKWNGWAFEYDADGRMTRACQSTTDCAGLYHEVEFVYDGDGHRTKVVQYDAGSGTAVATREFRYQGDAIVEEKLTDATHAGVVVRSYVVDESGSAVKLTIPGSESNPGDYLISWNGHGDALGLWRINTDGTLTLANSFTYSTWGAATVGTHNGYPDLGFRFRYVGEFDVQWDDVHGLGLYYMHARHYSPTLGRFLQPDPDRSEANLYGYAADNPVTEIDPDGNCFILCVIIIGALIFGAMEATAEVTRYAVHTPQRRWTARGAREAAVGGFTTGAVGGAVPGAGRVVTKAAAKILTKVPKVVRSTRPPPKWMTDNRARPKFDRDAVPSTYSKAKSVPGGKKCATCTRVFKDPPRKGVPRPWDIDHRLKWRMIRPIARVAERARPGWGKAIYNLRINLRLRCQTCNRGDQ